MGKSVGRELAQANRGPSASRKENVRICRLLVFTEQNDRCRKIAVRKPQLSLTGEKSLPTSEGCGGRKSVRGRKLGGSETVTLTHSPVRDLIVLPSLSLSLSFSLFAAVSTTRPHCACRDNSSHGELPILIAYCSDCLSLALSILFEFP